MYYSVLIVLLIATSSIWASPTKYQGITPLASVGGRIISGNPAKEGQFPWQVAIHFTTSGGSFFCGGSLISANWVLTAGHCVSGGLDFTVSMGSIDVNKPEQTFKVKQHILHEGYDGVILLNDIALLELDTPARLSDKVKPIGLDDRPLGENVPLLVSGWGKTHDVDWTISDNLNYVDLMSISNVLCQYTYGNLIKEGIVCAVGYYTKSTCNGDSGGPLTRNDNGTPIHVGVVSFVSAAGCESGHPSGYTRTAFYRSWIQSHTGI